METGLAQFVSDLLHSGRVIVADVEEGDIASTDRADAARTISEFEAQYRLELPGELERLPELDVHAAVWAAEMVFRTCQLIANRHHDAGDLAGLLSISCPSADSASQVYSVDIAFRFLPNLRQIAKTAAEEDPLLDFIDQWCKAFPLSSIGCKDCDATITSTILGHPTLMRLYADRVFSTDDSIRASEPAVSRQLALDVGTHEILRPQLGAKLRALFPARKLNAT